MSSGTIADDPRIKAIVELTEELARGERDFDYSVTKYNRQFKKRESHFDNLKADLGRDLLFRMLLNHPLPEVRHVAACYCGRERILAEEAEHTLQELAKGHDRVASEVRWSLDLRKRFPPDATVATEVKRREPIPFLPLPKGRTWEAAAALIKAEFPQRAEGLLPLLRQAIGLWPAKWDGNLLASRLGGLPALPKGQDWPEAEGEPLLFLGQIDCAELHGAIADNPFPDHGLLQFYGHPDDVSGCFPTYGCAVLYFDSLDKLKPASPPLEDVRVLIQCRLDFYETVELPDPESNAVGALGFTSAEKITYKTLRSTLAGHGMPFKEAEGHPSKLLGWPDLIQSDFLELFDPSTLLMQIGWYHDGSEWEGWDPGGLVYFLLDEGKLGAGRFGDAEIIMQCT